MDKFNRQWISENALQEVENYEHGILTIRGLHYRLVSRGMTNSHQHYKRVVSAMIKLRWEGAIDFDFFSDNDRESIGETKYEETSVSTEVESSRHYIDYWMNNYTKNLWENQPFYAEVFIEKKALQGVFSKSCDKYSISLNPCKGYPSLSFLYDSSIRFREAISKGKKPLILYFGDYDPSGEDIPRSIKQNLWDMGVELELKVISLTESQVVSWELPPAPAKKTDSRTKNWDGLGQVELDAVEPSKLIELCDEAIEKHLDPLLRNELYKKEKEEKEEYISIMKQIVSEM